MIRNSSLSAFVDSRKVVGALGTAFKMSRTKSGRKAGTYFAKQGQKGLAFMNRKRKGSASSYPVLVKSSGAAAPTPKDFTVPTTRQYNELIYSIVKALSNGNISPQIFCAGMEYFTPKGSTQPAPAGDRTKEGRVAPSKWNSPIPLGVTRKYKFTYGSDEKAMPVSSVAQPFKFTAYTSDSVVTSGWRKSDAHRQANVGLNQKLVKIYPTELTEVAMRRMSFMGQTREYNNYGLDSAIAAVWDSPSTTIDGGSLGGMRRSRYFPLMVENKFKITNLNTYLQINMKVYFVQHKEYTGGQAYVTPLSALQTAYFSMETLTNVLGPQTADMLYGNNAYGTTETSLDLSPSCVIKANASISNAPNFDEHYRVLKTQMINNINPGDVVEICTKQCQNINFTKDGDFADYPEGLSAVSKRPVFLMMEIVGRKDTVCYKFTDGDPVLREYDTRTGPVSVGFDQTMEFTNYHTNVIDLQGTSVYVKTYENYKQQANVSVLDTVDAADISATEINGKWTVPTTTEVEVKGATQLKNQLK
jgi:hypothetical protein